MATYQKQRTLQRLRCSVQNYEWGRIGADSQVSRLYSLNSGAEIEAHKPYAEFWMGTHESGPSFVLSVGSEDLTLKSWISQNPHVLGDKVLHKWGSDLPFLFKVISLCNCFMDMLRYIHSAPTPFKFDRM